MDTVVRGGGGRLRPRTLVLTFDDGPGATVGAGPGPRTLELAQYLATEQISATFFMCGKHVEVHPQIPAQVLSLGHQVGSHAWSHTPLPNLDDRAIRGELLATRRLLAECGVEGPIPLRPPYGLWDERTEAVVVADAELASGHSAVYLWNVNAGDWRFWAERGSTHECAEEYVRAALESDGGVVLMHDSSADPGSVGEQMRAGNALLDMVMLLVPMLRAEGFTFAPLTAVD